MEGRVIALMGAAGDVLARGYLGSRDDGRVTFEVVEGSARLRAAFFLAGVRAAWCEVEGQACEARLRTRWEQNQRVWFVDLIPARVPAAKAVAAA